MSHVSHEILFFSSAAADWFVAFVLGHNHMELAAFFCPSLTSRKQLQLAAPWSPVIVTDVDWGGRRGPEFLKWFTPFLDALPFTGWCSNYEIKVISKIVIGRDMEVPELWSELKRALINQSYSSPPNVIRRHSRGSNMSSIGPSSQHPLWLFSPALSPSLTFYLEL